MTWLEQHIWPAERAHVSEEFVHDGSLLAMAEMLRAGVTCVNDMYFFPEATARAALARGHAGLPRHHRDRVSRAPMRPTPRDT
jgi:5-methylthioadenosine/S-adenosylhomocysteine deaminase